MNKESRKQSFPAKIKERVDFIHGLTTEAEEGYRGSFTSYDTLMGDVVRELVKRGIVLKERDTTRTRCCYTYKWVATMSPTRALYGSVMNALRQKVREEKRQSILRAKERAAEEARKAVLQEIAGSPQEPAPEVKETPEVEKQINPLAGFTAKELWDEIKSRGYTIENNTIIRREVLE